MPLPSQIPNKKHTLSWFVNLIIFHQMWCESHSVSVPRAVGISTLQCSCKNLTGKITLKSVFGAYLFNQRLDKYSTADVVKHGLHCTMWVYSVQKNDSYPHFCFCFVFSQISVRSYIPELACIYIKVSKHLL